METMLKGNSGCTLTILRNDTSRVRKMSYSEDYNQRLEKQLEKQCLFHDYEIRKPTVFEKGIKEGLFYFDMEYINGNTLIDWVNLCDLDSLNQLIDQILKQICNNTVIEKRIIASELIDLKIDSLIERINDNYFKNLISVNRKVITDFDWSVIPISNCHGDLTLGNIIIGEDKSVFYIDFLDSFLDTWLIDIAKILQDSILFWSLRYDLDVLDENFNLRLDAVSSRVIDFLNRNFGNEIVGAVYRLLMLNIFRIIPYSFDDVTSKWIIRSSSKILKIINGG